MSDLPSGEWSMLLVGQHWPVSDQSSRWKAQSLIEHLSPTVLRHTPMLLQSIRSGPIASQEGGTAEDARDTFQAGESHARAIADRHDATNSSYGVARQSTANLRSRLSAIAAKGNEAIRAILASKDPLSIKVSKIVAIVTEAQAEATAAAASACGSVSDAIQNVLRKSGLDLSAREFANSHGVNLDRSFGSPDPDAVHDQVVKMLDSKEILAAQPDANRLRSGARLVTARDSANT